MRSADCDADYDHHDDDDGRVHDDHRDNDNDNDLRRCGPRARGRCDWHSAPHGLPCCSHALLCRALTFYGAPAGPLHSVVLSEPAMDVDISGKVVMITGASRGTNSSPLASLATGERVASAAARLRLGWQASARRRRATSQRRAPRSC